MNKYVRIVLSIIAISGIIFIINNTTVQAESDLEIKVKKSVSVKLADSENVTVRVYYQGRDVTQDAKLSFNNSNKSIIGVSATEADERFHVGGFEIWAKKAGKSTITITAKYRPSYYDDALGDVCYGETLTTTSKCVVKTQYHSSMRALLECVDYNTRNNTITFKVCNISNKKIKIMSAGAELVYVHGDEYGRKVCLAGGKSSITIKSGQTKKVKFKVLGNEALYDTDVQIFCYWKWRNKKYLLSVSNDDTYSDL